MSVDFTAWLGVSGSGLAQTDAAARAVAAWNRIQDKPTGLAFRTQAGTFLDEQTVRIESDSSSSASTSQAGKAATRRVVVFGVRDHPTETDTDLKPGYRFVYDEVEFRVMSIIKTIGEVQGFAEATP